LAENRSGLSRRDNDSRSQLLAGRFALDVLEARTDEVREQPMSRFRDDDEYRVVCRQTTATRFLVDHDSRWPTGLGGLVDDLG
jgi:hypothetical protein